MQWNCLSNIRLFHIVHTCEVYVICNPQLILQDLKIPDADLQISIMDADVVGFCIKMDIHTLDNVTI